MQMQCEKDNTCRQQPFSLKRKREEGLRPKSSQSPGTPTPRIFVILEAVTLLGRTIPRLLLSLCEVGVRSAQSAEQDWLSRKVEQLPEPEEEGEGVKSAHWSDAENDEIEIDASSWCFVAVTTPRGRRVGRLMSSGRSQKEEETNAESKARNRS